MSDTLIMRVSMRLLVLCSFVHVARTSCPSGWKEWRAQCLKVAGPDGGFNVGNQPACQQSCASLTESTAALVCVNSEAKNQMIIDWFNEADSIGGIPGRRSTRYFFWIGNYQTVKDGPWDACVSGESTEGYTSFSPTHATQSTMGAQPDDGVAIDGTRVSSGPEDCAVITADGWYDSECTGDTTFFCLCELHRSPSLAYRNVSWVASSSSAGTGGINAGNFGTALGAAAVIGLVPALVGALVCRTPSKAEWKQRVRTRVSRVMLSLGWLLIVFSLTPLVALVAQAPMFAGTAASVGEVYFVVMLPLGLICFILAVVPADLSSSRVPAFFILFYVFIAVITAVFAVTLARPGGIIFIVGLVWAAIGVVFAGLSVGVLRVSAAQPWRRLAVLWKETRAFLFLVSVTLIALAFIDAAYDVALGVAWGVSGATCLLLSAVTTMRCRNAFCIWLGTLGVSDVQAKIAAAQVFVDLAKPLTDGSTEMAHTTNA